jgi:hypothetical protein
LSPNIALLVFIVSITVSPVMQNQFTTAFIRVLKAEDLRDLLEMLYLACEDDLSCIILDVSSIFLSCLIFYRDFGNGDVSSVAGDGGASGVFGCSKLLS